MVDSPYMQWPNWRIWIQQMMYCFPYLQFSNSFTSPQPNTNKILGVYLTSSLWGGCVWCNRPSPCAHIETHHLCHPALAQVVARSLLTQCVWDLWVGVGSSALRHTSAPKLTQWELDNVWVGELYKPVMFGHILAAHTLSKATLMEDSIDICDLFSVKHPIVSTQYDIHYEVYTL